MTNELAIRILTGDVLGTAEQNQETITMAVKALSLPSAQQDLQPTCNKLATDSISRQAAIDAYGDWYVEEGTENGFIGTVKQLLEGLPPAQPEIILCKDCKYSIDFYDDGECYCRRPNRELNWIGDWNFNCGAAERRQECFIDAQDAEES